MIVHIKIGESKIFLNYFSFLKYDFIYRISDCIDNEYGRRYDESCERLEVGINCTQTINENCTKDAFFAKRLFVGGRLKQYKDSCYDQRFDQYFNQDGMCSFQDIKK